MYPRDGRLQKVETDLPERLHATLLVSSIRVPTLSGEDINTKAILHQSQTIKLVNQAVRGEREVDDGIIAAVLGLTGYEVGQRRSLAVI